MSDNNECDLLIDHIRLINSIHDSFKLIRHSIPTHKLFWRQKLDNFLILINQMWNSGFSMKKKTNPIPLKLTISFCWKWVKWMRKFVALSDCFTPVDIFITETPSDHIERKKTKRICVFFFCYGVWCLLSHTLFISAMCIRIRCVYTSRKSCAQLECLQKYRKCFER